MKNLGKLLGDFLDQLEINPNDRVQVESNLLSSIYLDYLSKSVNLNKELINKYPLDKNATFEEFESIINKIKSELKSSDFDFETTFKTSAQNVLNGFISQIESRITPEKKVVLQKTITELLIGV